MPETKRSRQGRKLLAKGKTPAAIAAALGVTVRQVYHYRGVRRPKPLVTDAERLAIARLLRGHSHRQAAHISGRSRKVVDAVAALVAAGKIRLP